jgi:hypothetical protein
MVWHERQPQHARVETVKKQIQTFEQGKLYPQQIAEQSQRDIRH